MTTFDMFTATRALPFHAHCHGMARYYRGLARLLLPVLLMLPAMHVFAEEGFDARFTLRAYGATVGTLTWKLEIDDTGGMTLDADSRTAGLASFVRDVREHERTTLRWFGSALRPVRYRYERTGDKRARVVEVSMGWTESRARGHGAHGEWELPLEPSTLDDLSYVLAMMADLRAGKRQLHYQLIGEGTGKTLEFQVRDSQTLDTTLGSLETLRVERVRDDGRATTYWCAPSLGYIPVRILHEERDGWSVDVGLEALVGRPPAALSFE